MISNFYVNATSTTNKSKVTAIEILFLFSGGGDKDFQIIIPILVNVF